MAKLGDIATIQSGGTPARSIAEYWEDGTIPWVKISDIKSRHLNQTEEMITEAGLENSSAKIFPKGTILYTIFATLGETSILDINAATNQAIAGISITDSRVLPDYLYYYLLSQKIHVQKIGRGVAQNNINMKLLRDFDVPLPSKEAQLNIIEQLNRVTELLFLRKQQLTKLDELIKARFVEMFGDPIQNEKCWETKSLFDLGYCKNGMNFHKGDHGVEIHCLGVGDFKDRSTIHEVENLPFVSLNESPDPDYLLQDGDIVFVRSNGNKELVGRCLAIYPANVPVTYSGFCIRYRLTSKEASAAYLLRVLKADSVRKKMAGRGANIQNLNQQTLSQLAIPLPPLSLQNQFADFVAEVDKSKVEVQKALDQTQLLFDSLMQQYFG